MADRVSASITIGGTLPRSLLPELAALVEAEGLSTEWDGEPFTLVMLREDVALELMAHEVAWGRFEALESWCVEHGLRFARWSGACVGQWGAERAVFTGVGEVQCYAATRTTISSSAAAPPSVWAATRLSSPTSRRAISPYRRCGGCPEYRPRPGLLTRPRLT